MARRQPLLLGTPSCATSTRSGSLHTLRCFSYDDSAFPKLPGTTVAPQDLSAKPSSTFKDAMMKTVRSVPAVPPPTFQSSNLPTDTRRDRQFEQQCISLEDKIVEQQHEAAKTILRNLHSGDHDPWLVRLRSALLGEEPFTYSKPTPKPKSLYKKAFIPYFTDTTPMPPSSTTVLVHKPTMRDSNILHYDDWTDYAIEYYGQRHSTVPTLIPKRKRVLRQSSTIRPCQKVSIPATTTPSRSMATTRPNGAPALTNELRRSPSSKYEFQYSSYHQQHTAYWKQLDEPHTELQYCNHRYFGHSLRGNMENKGDRALNGMDIKGRTKHHGRSLLRVLDHKIQSVLYHVDPASWKLHLQFLQLCLNTYCTKQTSGSDTAGSTMSHQRIRSYKSPPHIGLGIAHFSLRHRIQRRAQRLLKSIAQKASAPHLRLHSPSFVHSLDEFTPRTDLIAPFFKAATASHCMLK